MRRTTLMLAVMLAGCAAPMPSVTSVPMPMSSTPDETAIPESPPSDVPSPSQTGLSRDQAIDAARAAAPQSAHHPVTVAEAGAASDLVGSAQIATDVPGDRWIWYIVLSDLGPLSGEGSIVILDFFDGQVYEVVNVIG